ncbi:MAG: hypothetical protein K1X87_12230 [Dehalococcoidia bacterium]|nr:hypothetical protein [Dehalococcoidia bacterium]
MRVRTWRRVMLMGGLLALAALVAMGCGDSKGTVQVRPTKDGLTVIGAAGDTTAVEVLNDSDSNLQVQVIALGGRSVAELKAAGSSLPSWAKPVATIDVEAGKYAADDVKTDQKGGYAIVATGGSQPLVAELSRQKVEAPVAGGKGGATGSATAAALPTVPAAGPVGSNSATINVSLKEFAVAAQPASTGSGQITFNVKNDGAVIHELVVIRTEVDAAGLPQSGGKVDETSGALEVKGKAQNIAGGGSGKVDATGLPAGKYVLICNVPGHYQAGMRVGFTVQ